MFEIKLFILEIKQSMLEIKQSMLEIKQSMFEIKQSNCFVLLSKTYLKYSFMLLIPQSSKEWVSGLEFQLCVGCKVSVDLPLKQLQLIKWFLILSK